MTVGQVRRAIGGLGDEAPVVLFQLYSEDSEGGALVELADARPDGGALALVLLVTCFEDLLGHDEEEER